MLRNLKVNNLDLYQKAVSGAQQAQKVMSGITAAVQGAIAGGGAAGAARKTESVEEHIVKHGSEYRLVSKSTGKNLGTFKTRAAAEKHEREVQYFKHQIGRAHV